MLVIPVGNFMMQMVNESDLLLEKTGIKLKDYYSKDEINEISDQILTIYRTVKNNTPIGVFFDILGKIWYNVKCVVHYSSQTRYWKMGLKIH